VQKSCCWRATELAPGHRCCCLPLHVQRTAGIAAALPPPHALQGWRCPLAKRGWLYTCMQMHAAVAGSVYVMVSQRVKLLHKGHAKMVARSGARHGCVG
jgi:hypothetical protein